MSYSPSSRLMMPVTLKFDEKSEFTGNRHTVELFKYLNDVIQKPRNVGDTGIFEYPSHKPILKGTWTLEAQVKRSVMPFVVVANVELY